MKAYGFRELVRKLRDHDGRFSVDSRRGKGSHRMLVHPDVGGQRVTYPLAVHSEGATVSPVYVKAIRRRFALPEKFFD